MRDLRTGPLPQPAATGLLPLLQVRGLRRLIAVRVASSLGDGAFQGAVVSAVILNPTRESSAGAIAAAFAVLLLPYSLIGPFAGALLDRWSRRTVIIGATSIRITLLLALALELALSAPSSVLLVTALAVTGAARFVGSGLSASLPHTIAPRSLIGANSLAVTCGSIANALGAGYALLARNLIGETDAPLAIVTASVTVFYLAAIALVSWFRRMDLGPTISGTPPNPMRAVAAGLITALRHTVERPTVGLAISLVVLVRFCFGMATLLILLLYQHYFTVSYGPLLPGVGGLAEVLAAISVGLFVGAISTPVLVKMLGRTQAMVAMTVLAGLTVLICGPQFSLLATMIAAPLLAFTYQVVKVCVDTIIQNDADDEHIGRVFALYDTINNVAYVGAFAIGALFVADDGRSVGLLLAMAAVYVVSAVAYPALLRAANRRHTLITVPHRH